MILTKNARPLVKKTGAFINPKSHKQKKYFSLMLVPSHSTGKTRSIRIPQKAFYGVVLSVLIVSAVTLAFYLRGVYYEREAQEMNLLRDQLLEEYTELQQESADLQSQYRDDSNELKSQLTDEQNRYQAEKNRQRQDYQGTLDDLQKQVGDLEQQLREVDAARAAIMEQLSAKSYIPPVRPIVEAMDASQARLLDQPAAVHIRSDERASSKEATVADLYDYFLALDAKMEIQLAYLTDLQAYAQQIRPYSKNYPTTRPVNGQISSGFGYRTNAMGGSGGESHTGIDFRCPTGTDVRVTGGGTVSQSGWNGSYGYLVVVDHGFGIQTMYAHNSSLLVSVGQRVERGDVIAESGSTGRSSGPHVHYEVRVNGAVVSPLDYLLE